MSSQTFKVFAPRLKAARSDDGRMTLHGVASSTIKDLHGDQMTLNALRDMERTAMGMTVFLNHSYTVPEDVGGTVVGVRLEMWPDGTGADLPIDIEVNQSNPRALNAFESIENRTLLGISIGAVIPDGGAKYDKKAGGYIIDHVQLLEASLVGVPANPRSWVEYAVKALGISTEDAPRFEAVVDEVDVEDAAKPKAHQHPHAHGHDHEHTHGWGQTENVHSHEHAHQHSHSHGDDHEHEDSMNDSEHDHWHRTGEDKDHAHENSGTYNSAEGAIDDHSHLDTVEAAQVDMDTAEAVTPAAEEPESDITLDAEPALDASMTEVETESLALDDTPTPQDAPESIPEDEGGELPEAVTASADEAISDIAPLVLASLGNGNAMLAAITSELVDLRLRVSTAERERDEAVEMAQKALSDTASILEALAATPAGRRAVVRETSTKFEHLSGVYSDTFLKMLRS